MNASARDPGTGTVGGSDEVCAPGPGSLPRQRLLQVLEDLTAACREDALLWRGAGLDGRDIDVLIAGGDLSRATRVLLRHRMVPTDLHDPWCAWTHVEGVLPPIDLKGRHQWPRRYQSMSGVLHRAVRRSPMPTVSSEDLLLLMGSDALAGRDLAKLSNRVAQTAASDPAACARAQELAEAEGVRSLWRATAASVLTSTDRRGRLRLSTACRIAVRCRAGRRGLRDRIVTRLSKRVARATSTAWALISTRAERPLLIALSGMDGSGKSTLAAALVHHLGTLGAPVESSWARLGNETKILEAVAHPVKRWMRRTGTIADPVVTAGPRVGKRQDPRAAAGQRGPVEWTWILLVALVAVRTQRRRLDGRRRGAHLVCDRWAADALVDLDLRYGRHRMATMAVRALSPKPDLALLLEVDATVAAGRKPDDKALSTLEDMESAYAHQARALGLFRLDASQPPDEVCGQAVLLVDAALLNRPRPGQGRVRRRPTPRS